MTKQRKYSTEFKREAVEQKRSSCRYIFYIERFDNPRMRRRVANQDRKFTNALNRP